MHPAIDIETFQSFILYPRYAGTVKFDQPDVGFHRSADAYVTKAQLFGTYN